MAHRDILIDSSIFIDFLRKNHKTRTILWQVMEQELHGIISTITVFELYAGAVTEQHVEDLQRLLKWFELAPFSEAVAKRAAAIYLRLKSENKLVGFKDIFIGATAVELDIPVLTLNHRHFQRIEGLALLPLDKFTGF